MANKQNKRSGDKTAKTEKIHSLIGVLAIVAIIVIVVAINNNHGQLNDDNGTIIDRNQIGGYQVPEEVIRDFCQHPTRMQKYFNLDTFDVIANPFRYDQPRQMYTDMGIYDSTGNSIMYYTWNGYDKISSSIVQFGCYAGGSDADNLVVYSLRAFTNGVSVTLEGAEDFDMYNKDGELIK